MSTAQPIPSVTTPFTSPAADAAHPPGLRLDELVHPRERQLGGITLVLGIVAWLVLVVGTFGGALLGLALGFLAYLFAQSALIAHLKGNGVELSARQFPDLHAQFTACCDRLQIDPSRRPQAFILNGNGGLNAFATKFLGTQYVVLMSDVVDAMAAHADGVRFYIGHELGHLRMRHLDGHLLRWPVLWLPLLGAAYARARESTCDRHGLACSDTPEGAVRALAALAAGSERWKQLDVPAYVAQAGQASGFWMSFHELIAGYPWLTRRAARVLDPRAAEPSRQGLAYVLAACVPYAGRMGAGFGTLMLVYIVGVLLAVALPAYQSHAGQARLRAVVEAAQGSRDALGAYYASSRKVPRTLEAIGLRDTLPDGTRLSLDPERMVLSAATPQGTLHFIPSADSAGLVTWACRGGEGVRTDHLPPECREQPAPAAQ